MEGSLLPEEGEVGGGSTTMPIPELIPPPGKSELEEESIVMILWRAEQWSDALAGDELSIAARELGQGILFRAVNSLSPHPPIQPDEITNSQIEGEEDTNLGGRIVQGRESSTIRGDFPLLGMEIIFPRPATEEDGAIQIVD